MKFKFMYVLRFGNRLSARLSVICTEKTQLKFLTLSRLPISLCVRSKLCEALMLCCSCTCTCPGVHWVRFFPSQSNPKDLELWKRVQANKPRGPKPCWNAVVQITPPSVCTALLSAFYLHPDLLSVTVKPTSNASIPRPTHASPRCFNSTADAPRGRGLLKPKCRSNRCAKTKHRILQV